MSSAQAAYESSATPIYSFTLCDNGIGSERIQVFFGATSKYFFLKKQFAGREPAMVCIPFGCINKYWLEGPGHTVFSMRFQNFIAARMRAIGLGILLRGPTITVRIPEQYVVPTKRLVAATWNYDVAALGVRD